MRRKLTEFLAPWKKLNKPYIVSASKQLLYSEIFQLIQMNHQSLKKIRAIRGNVAILCDNSAEYVVAFWSIIFSESTVVPLNPKLSDNEIRKTVVFTDCNWIICTDLYKEAAINLHDCEGVGVLLIRDDCSLNLIRKSKFNFKRQNNQSVALLIATSGTTNNPKVVMLTHENLITNTKSSIDILSVKFNDVALIVLPLTYSYATSQFLCHTMAGATIALYQKPIFVSKEFYETACRYRITTTCLVPTMVCVLNKYKMSLTGKIKFLKAICVGGGPVSSPQVKALLPKLKNVRVIIVYGLTECSPRVTTHSYKHDLNKIASVGKPIPGVLVRVVDDKKSVLKPNQTGELIVKGKNVTPGYYKNKKATSKLIINGWLHTGDLAKYDENGYVYIVGRKKNVIISGGINIYPEEAEETLLQHKNIKAVMVSGEADKLLGEVPVAHVVLNKKIKFEINDLYNYLDGKISRFKWPKKIYIKKELSQTISGKIKRF